MEQTRTEEPDRNPKEISEKIREEICREEHEDISEEISEAAQPCCCCSAKTKERSAEEYKDLIHRLNRIEGQVRGLKNMVEKDAYCTDIITQVAAVNAALSSFNRVLLANHIRTCVTDDIKAGKEETVDDLIKVLQKLMK